MKRPKIEEDLITFLKDLENISNGESRPRIQIALVGRPELRGDINSVLESFSSRCPLKRTPETLQLYFEWDSPGSSPQEPTYLYTRSNKPSQINH